MELIKFITFTIGIIFLGIFAGYYRSLCFRFRDRNVAQQKYIKFLKEEILKSKLKESALIKECRDWKLKATAPMMPDPNPPIIIHKSDLQKVIIHTELDRFKSKEQAIREGVDKLRDFIAPMVYSEFREDYGN